MLLFTLAQAFRLFPAQIWERQYQCLNFPSDSDRGLSKVVSMSAQEDRVAIRLLQTELISSVFPVQALSPSVEDLTLPWH